MVFLKYVKIYLSVEILVIENTLSTERNGIFIITNSHLAPEHSSRFLANVNKILFGFTKIDMKYNLSR